MYKARHYWIIFAVVAALSGSAVAATCPNPIASPVPWELPAGGCSYGDKLFTNFSFTPHAALPASASLRMNEVQTNAGYTLAVDGFMRQDFSLSYTVSVLDSVCPNCYITGLVSDIAIAFGAPEVRTTVVGVGTATVKASQRQQIINVPKRKSIDVVNEFTVPVSRPGQMNVGTNITNTIVQAQVPEPAATWLAGVGLIGLGALGRRRRRRA